MTGTGSAVNSCRKDKMLPTAAVKAAEYKDSVLRITVLKSEDGKTKRSAIEC